MKQIIFIITILAINACCPHHAPCVTFSADELAWIPYKDGEVVTFKSNLTGNIKSFTATKTHEGTYPNNTCTEGQNYCESYLDMCTSSGDSLGWCFSLHNENNYNDIKKKSYKVWLDIGNARVFDSQSNNSNLQTRVVNGVSYSNVVFLYSATYDTVFYAKGFGFIAYHKIVTNEWFYKQ